MRSSLQKRLTLWSVAVMAILAGTIGGIDLANAVDREFRDALERSALLMRLSVDLVLRTLERQPSLEMRDALLGDRRLPAQLLDTLTQSQSLLEISVVGRDGRILVSSDAARAGAQADRLPDFRELVTRTGAVERIRLLFEASRNYQLEEALGLEGQSTPVLFVRVVVSPALIREKVNPVLRTRLEILGVSVLGAIVVALVYSVLAFRPLGKLSQMLDSVARGELAPVETKAAADELGVVASKVSLLGQQLRGARVDITELRGNFERLLEDLEDAVLIFGRDRQLMLASGAVEKFLGRPREQLVGETLERVFSPATTLGLILAQAAETGRAMRNRRVLVEPPDGGQALVALLTVDIIENVSAGASVSSGMLVRLHDPEATRQLGRKLQTADRLSAVSHITGGVAHEVKNPLNAMLMHVEIAKMKLARGDYDLQQQMDIISKEIVRLDRVVKTFLDFTRPVELKDTQIEVDQFVAEIVDLARPQAAAAGIEIAVDQDAAGAVIRIDVDLMKQALLNIVVNAIEAMGRGGRLTFESHVREDEVEIRISDTGPGIPEPLREKIFRLYFTTKKEGSGIGLAMTFRIVQLHDGFIDFTSEPGRGTSFLIRLPAAI